ncbi:hypothetical protein BC826DRAFT_1030083 [Russula brevipes]|nr:hypothetical protein BC826DRAFT_1030083 [Russula brevipes]
MNRPRESLLTLFDPLFSGGPTTPPSCRDVPSPDLGSDKENAVPAHDNAITLTKFFNRVYTRPKVQPPRSLPKDRLIDLSDLNVSDDNSDSGDDGQNEHVFVVNHHEPLLTSREDAQDSPQRRPLADIALEDSGSSPVAAKRASLFGTPSPFRLVRPSPAPSSSPLASVINAINGASSPPPPSTPSAPRIAVTPAEPSSPSPSPTRHQLRPGAMLHASPDTDSRRTSVDLQESLSVHFDDSSFDLLKDKILLPENDSMGDLDMDIGPRTTNVSERENKEVVAAPSADIESEDEPDFGAELEERLRDIDIISTPPPQPSGDNVSTPQAPVRQFLRPRNKLQGPSAPIISTAPRANLPRRSVRASISALPMPASTTAQRITKVAKADIAPAPVTASIPARKPAGRAMSHTATSAPPPRGMAFGGVQRHPVATKVAPPSTASASSRVRFQRNKQVTGQASSTTSKVASVGTTGPRPSGLRPPTSRVGAAGIAMPRDSISGGAVRLSTAAGGRLGSTGVTKTGIAKGKGDGASATARMMRRA